MAAMRCTTAQLRDLLWEWGAERTLVEQYFVERVDREYSSGTRRHKRFFSLRKSAPAWLRAALPLLITRKEPAGYSAAELSIHYGEDISLYTAARHGNIRLMEHLALEEGKKEHPPTHWHHTICDEAMNAGELALPALKWLMDPATGRGSVSCKMSTAAAAAATGQYAIPLLEHMTTHPSPRNNNRCRVEPFTAAYDAVGGSGRHAIPILEWLVQHCGAKWLTARSQGECYFEQRLVVQHVSWVMEEAARAGEYAIPIWEWFLARGATLPHTTEDSTWDDCDIFHHAVQQGEHSPGIIRWLNEHGCLLRPHSIPEDSLERVRPVELRERLRALIQELCEFNGNTFRIH